MKQAQIITIAIIKGGTGKTTTAAALSQAAEKDKKKVLLIDLDAQANLTTLFKADPTAPGAYELLNGYPVSEVIQKTEFNIDIISGAANLATEKTTKGSLYRLESAIEPLKSIYDYIFIDTPPTLGEMTFNALQSSNGLICTLEANTSSIQGLYQIYDLSQAATKTNPNLKLLACVITRYNPRIVIQRKMRDIIAARCKSLECPLLFEIRQGVSLQEAQAYQKSIYDYAPHCYPAEDYRTLYNQLFNKKRRI